MIPAILAAGGALLEGAAAIGGALLTTEGVALAGSAASAYVAKQAAVAAGTRAAATVGLGAVAASAVPWVIGGLTVYQLGKLGCKLLSDDKK